MGVLETCIFDLHRGLPSFYRWETSLFLCECVLMSEAVPRLLNAARVVFIARVVFMAWFKPTSCHVVPVCLTSLAMVAFTFQPKLVSHLSG